MSDETVCTEAVTTMNLKPPHKKQKRKETLLTRPLNEEDIELEFQIIEEPSPMIPEVEVKRKPRKEYRTKKRVRLAMEDAAKREETKEEEATVEEIKKEVPREEEEQPPESQPQPQQQPQQSLPPQQTQVQPPPQPQTERRTRLSNTCRVATGKSYKCNDCDFSTDRINNIILHVKESCPNLKKVST